MNAVPSLYRVVLQVSDMPAAVRFYEALLATRGRDIHGTRHYFDCGPVILALVDPAEDDEPARPNPDHVYFAVDDLPAVHARARRLGCLAAGEVHDAPAGEIVVRPWGERSFYARDPAGNPLCFVDATTLFTGRARGAPGASRGADVTSAATIAATVGAANRATAGAARTRCHVHEERFEVAPERLFALLHTPSAIRQWWGASTAIVMPQAGGLWAATWGGTEDAPDYTTQATLSVFEPPTRLVLADYRYRAASGPLPFAAEFVTEFRVSPDGRGARLRVAQDGFPAGPEADAHLAACASGWGRTFAGIRRFLA